MPHGSWRDEFHFLVVRDRRQWKAVDQFPVAFVHRAPWADHRMVSVGSGRFRAGLGRDSPRCWTSCPVKVRKASSQPIDGGVRSTAVRAVSSPKATSGPTDRETPRLCFRSSKTSGIVENRLVTSYVRRNLRYTYAATVNCGQWLVVS